MDSLGWRAAVRGVLRIAPGSTPLQPLHKAVLRRARPRQDGQVAPPSVEGERLMATVADLVVKVELADFPLIADVVRMAIDYQECWAESDQCDAERTAFLAAVVVLKNAGEVRDGALQASAAHGPETR